MTKKFLVFLIGFVFLGLIVFAQTPEENFQKAGQSELAKKETVLQQKKAEIEKFFDEMANDAVISSLEMRTLKQEVDEFDMHQEEYNKELEFYGLKTAVEISEVIRKQLKIYFDYSKEDGDSGNLYFRDNEKQEIRRYFVEQTGQDIKVEKGDNLGEQAGLAFFIALMAGLFLWIAVLVASDSFKMAVGTGIAAFIFIFFLIYLLL